jgi:hypothetical protein
MAWYSRFASYSPIWSPLASSRPSQTRLYSSIDTARTPSTSSTSMTSCSRRPVPPFSSVRSLPFIASSRSRTWALSTTSSGSLWSDPPGPLPLRASVCPQHYGVYWHVQLQALLHVFRHSKVLRRQRPPPGQQCDGLSERCFQVGRLASRSG